MAKALKDILEVYAPRSKDEKRFKDKHVVARSKLDKPSEDDAVFNATNVKVIDREKTKHGYNPNKDEAVYEETDYSKHGPKAIVVSHAGKGKYKVHHVGKHFANGIDVGEHLSDSELDDAADMGAKIINKNTETKVKIKEEVIDEKHLTPAEMKARERIAKGIEKSNPNMPMGKKMAIATAKAKEVAEEVEDITESDNSHKAFQEQHNMAAKHLKGITKALSDHYNNVTHKDSFNKGEAQWRHVSNIKNINRALEDLHQQIAQETDWNKPPKPIKEDLDDEDLELLNIVYDSLSEENKEIFEDIWENNPDQLYDFLDQLEVQNG
jgi:hypothetical protein